MTRANATSSKVSFRSTPASKVFLDDKLVGESPVAGVEVEPGRHRVLFVSEDPPLQHAQDLAVTAGEELDLDIDLQPRRFSVDTHLFRELGELLVGRESTALIELVKNAYDADATKVVVFGQNLGEPSRGVIRISDDGVGMTLDTFVRGFLRIASRTRTGGDRRSLRWSRRFTGAKGIGRLAAHKLARRVEIQSISWTKESSRERPAGVGGHIDWDEVEKAETLDMVSAAAVTAVEQLPGKNDVHGTTLTLSRLRNRWTKAQLSKFLVEVEGLRAPPALCEPLPRSAIAHAALFERPLVVDGSTSEPGFRVQLEGEFEVGDNYWPAVIDAASWLLEIDASPKAVRYSVAPTKKTLAERRAAKAQTFSEAHPASDVGPFFHARILIREGKATGKREESGWAARASGVRVYMEGFRVLPYGEERDDWLALTRDNTDRTRSLHFLEGSAAAAKLEEVDQEGLLLLPSKHYYGAVFLTANRAGTLEMLVNREGFVPDASYERLVTLVRRGIDLATRVRAAAKSVADGSTDSGGDETGTRSSSGEASHGSEKSSRGKAEGSLRRLTMQATELAALAEDAPPALAKRLRAAANEIELAAQVSRELIPANSMVLVLASVGTQLAAFTHEVNRLLALASDVEAVAGRLRNEEMPPKLRAQVTKVGASAADLRRAIERQAAYLIDIITPDARRRRSRHRVGEVLEATWRLVSLAAEQRGIKLRNEVSEGHRSPPMFRAELMAVWTNLLTNAVKAAGKDGAIKVSSDEDGDALVVNVENTGEAVDLAEGERWFRPFESTTVEVDPVLGQGMGLGLGITRDLLSEVGATIKFVRPSRGYATAIQVSFPGART